MSYQFIIHRMSILLDGKLTIPLYHGTNELFYDSIKKHGLGGRNIINELQVVEMLREVIAVCEKCLPVDDDWILQMQAANWVAGENVTEGGFNFRHGTVYLTPLINLALTYATSYDFGSEALAYFMMLWDRVLANDVKLPQSVIDQSLQIVQFASGTKTPLIVQLDSVPGSILSAENGGPTTPIFERIETYVSGPLFLFRSMCQQANFELHQPVPISEAKVFRLVKDSSSQQEQFSLVPYHSTLVPGRNCSSEHERRWMRSEFGSWAEI